MSKRALYRKHRPVKMSDVVGQDHITKTLQNALKKGRISHAYLFSGPRGVGKTSVARILAHEVNDLDYSDDQTSLDIIEIDAASNRRIDEIRDLRDKIGISPVGAKYKVYIIDEVHMLTKEAFNALLKTLEEPPEHAIFILATTEAHKLPETIISRTQHFTFQPISIDASVGLLSELAKKENINTTPEALEMIAKHSDGSFRDAISLLDQMSSNEGSQLTAQMVEEALGLAKTNMLSQILKSVSQGNAQSLLTLLDSAYKQGVTAPTLSIQLIGQLRNQWLDGQSAEHKDLALIDSLIEAQYSKNARIKLETVLLTQAIKVTGQVARPAPAKQAVTEQTKQVSSPQNSDQKKSSEEVAQPKDIDVVESKLFDEASWQTVLAKIKETNNSLYAVLRMARAGLNGSDDTVILTFKFPFHLKQVQIEGNKKVVEKALSDTVGQSMKLKLKVDKDLAVEQPATAPQVEAASNDKNIDSVMDIMGGGEVVSI